MQKDNCSVPAMELCIILIKPLICIMIRLMMSFCCKSWYFVIAMSFMSISHAYTCICEIFSIHTSYQSVSLFHLSHAHILFASPWTNQCWINQCTGDTTALHYDANVSCHQHLMTDSRPMCPVRSHFGRGQWCVDVSHTQRQTLYI